MEKTGAIRSSYTKARAYPVFTLEVLEREQFLYFRNQTIWI
jgi:hypothetical protein